MDPLPRLLVLIGSGETAARMTRVHRMVVQRLLGDAGPARGEWRAGGVQAAILDTPYGFQENADALSAGLRDYFSARIGVSAAVATLRRADADVLSRETAFARIRHAQFVFSGPGSPSYALRHWRETPIPQLLSDKLTTGGAVTFASAAALTLGRLTLPVYEIYKTGDDPHWLPGLDLLATLAINAAVVPHFDNAEGGTHDTRFCYLGERRLRVLEEQLPDETIILGIDEHTALVFDLAAETATVHGRGGATIRQRGESRVLLRGETVSLGVFRATAATSAVSTRSAAPQREEAGAMALVADRLVALEKELAAGHEREVLVEPLVETLLEVRAAARDRGDYATADSIRRRLVALGVEISDAPGGTAFQIRPDLTHGGSR